MSKPGPDDWLTCEFGRTEREWQELPEWARPITVPPAFRDVPGLNDPLANGVACAP